LPCSVVTHGVAEDALRREGELRHQVGQLGEIGLTRQQQVEAGIAQQREGELQPTLMRPARPAVRRNGPDLRRTQAQPARVKGAAEGERHDSGPVPAHLDYSRLETGDGERRCEPIRSSARMDYEVDVAARLLRRGEAAAER